MRLQTPVLFLLLIMSQALHSIEEFVFRLWEVLAPARYVGALFNADPSVGFVIVNLGIVALGLWCYLWPVRQQWRSAVGIIWFWTLLELANSIGHSLFAVGAGGYFPGLYTAPVLFLCSTALLTRLLIGNHGPSVNR